MRNFDCARWLGTELPALLGGTPGAAAIIQMIVVDREDCDLAYDIDAHGVISVRPGISDRVDLTLSFLSADIEALVAGTLDVARALRTRRLKIMGDATLLAWMSDRLGRHA